MLILSYYFFMNAKLYFLIIIYLLYNLFADEWSTTGHPHGHTIDNYVFLMTIELKHLNESLPLFPTEEGLKRLLGTSR